MTATAPAPEGGPAQFLEGLRPVEVAVGSSYGSAALLRETERVRGAPRGERNVSLFQAACRIGELVAGGEVLKEAAEDSLVDAAADSGLSRRDALGVVRRGLRRGQRHPRSAPGRDTWTTPRRSVIAPARVADFDQFASRCQEAVDHAELACLVARLGVTRCSLRLLGVGWSPTHRAWTFPMVDAGRRKIGVRLRLPDGRKLSVRGGHEGLFVPGVAPGSSDLWVTEGPTDAAAALDLGLADVVGRPSCAGGVQIFVEFVGRRRPARVVIVADNDAGGQTGAARLAAQLALYVPDVRVVTPPPQHNDLRAWLRAGATRADVERVTEAASPWRVGIRSWRHG